MPEEHIGQVGFEYAWRELLARSRIAGEDYDSSLRANANPSRSIRNE